jgi:hypothetical protein
MSIEAEQTEAPGGPQPEASSAGEPGSPLPRPLQEHLGQQLRTTYHELAPKPAFLGDPAIPPEFEHHLQRLETREKIHNQGVEAVKAALEDLDIAAPEDERRDE